MAEIQRIENSFNNKSSRTTVVSTEIIDLYGKIIIS